ncbi:MAG: hypothetical protein H7099_19210 [Gemmatimonadaceae bacterium]|nr:hypothetical protein [Gemmatimonadaceae bacterium]
MHTATQPIAFATDSGSAGLHTPTFLSRCGGAVIGGVMLLCVFVSGFSTVVDGAWAIWLVLAGSLLLIVAAMKNWRLQWNAFGRLMRYLIGERATRVYFVVAGVMFALGGLLAMAASSLAVP